jgi:hypothetical protein
MFTMKASLAAAVFLVALLVPSASAQQRYIYVANAGEDTVSKIDIITNQEVARYATWFTAGTNHIAHIGGPWTGPAPSRIARDSAGNVYVLNRFFPQRPQPPTLPPPNLHLPVLLKIVPSGGTLTSIGPVPLPMLDNVIVNNKIDSGEAKDMRILWGKEIGNAGDEGALGRAVCIDTTGVLWVGLWGRYQFDQVFIPNMQKYYRVDAATGQILPPLAGIPTPGHSAYGCQVDTKGRLWSVDEHNTLAEIDTFTNQVTIHNHATPINYGRNYSVSLFNSCGSAPSKVYFSDMSGKTYIAYDPQTSSFSAAPLPVSAQFASVAIGVDTNGDIVSGEWHVTGRVIKSHPNGVIVWDTKTVSLTNTVPTTDLHGIIIDANNDVWAVHLRDNWVVKYSGVDGHWIATVPVGDSPYTYGNPPPPACPCAEIRENPIRCEGQSGGTATYSWSFTFTNHSPFSTPATAIDISSSQVTNLTPTHVQFTNPVPPNGQATVSGTFTVANPMPGMQVCLDIRLNAGEGWCCPIEHVCFLLPECPTCAKLQGKFICQHGHPVLQLSVTNLGPTAAQSVQVFSNTPGVTVSPQMTMQTFPQNTPVTIPLTVTGATGGQTISLTVNLEGPIDPKTGVNSWCCTATVTVTYPNIDCNPTIEGWIFNDMNRDGVRDSEEDGLSEWTVTLTDGKGASRTTTSDATGTYRLEEVPPGTYRLSVQPAKGWRATGPESGVYTVTIAGPPGRKFDFGFVRIQ